MCVCLCVCVCVSVCVCVVIGLRAVLDIEQWHLPRFSANSTLSHTLLALQMVDHEELDGFPQQPDVDVQNFLLFDMHILSTRLFPVDARDSLRPTAVTKEIAVLASSCYVCTSVTLNSTC